MSYLKQLLVKDSGIQGSGLFADEPIKMGEVVMIWSVDCSIIKEADYNKEQANGNENMVKTGARFVDGIFLYTDDRPRLENYINHSADPNILYHCGVCFALHDIVKGEELTVDYSHVLAAGDYNGFHDAKTGLYVDGLDSLECLRQTTAMLTALLSKVKDDVYSSANKNLTVGSEKNNAVIKNV